MRKEHQLIIDTFENMYPNPKCELEYKNDYELLVAITLSAQTTDKAVNKITPSLFQKYPTINSLANAIVFEVENIIKTIGLYKTKTKNIINMAKEVCEKYEEIIPNDFQKLILLSGVGRKTANVFLAEYYQVPKIAVDTHVFRISKRLNLAKENDNVFDVEQKLMKIFPKELWIKIHHQMIFFGRYHCFARKPNCQNCRLLVLCKEKNKNL